MKFIPRTRANDKLYSNGPYETHIKRKTCCGQDPDLYEGSTTVVFLSESVYMFKCPKCKRKGGTDITPNGAAVCWNKTFENQK